ncbi:hypothetical protein DMA15_36105 [Streptomyces sp. WAC 01529]|uniref:hypothetical protein n=1 Tax=Streptomyces sp. WAC 01529 TaxID=2203205 RepID=UPI000F6E3B0D|nr:hypothetical protein [Streptomyces sp. WAC 01529]AZM57313.1 hypothetical protein DMA15_36105 [Streptomyces sp. WAC 01529]
MANVQSVTAGVQAQYAAQVAEDLESNRKEQERIEAEMAALQEKLEVLQRDCRVLENVQQALETSHTSASGAKKPSIRKKQVPAQRAHASKSGEARAKSPAGAGTRTNTAQKTPKAAVNKPSAPEGGSTLVELISAHLGQQSEPRSTAEITTALAKAHPDRNIKATVVRTTVEGLVAKGRAERTRQGSSVFYTAVAQAAEPSDTQQPQTPTN